MTYQILEWAENHLNTDAEFARFNIFPTSVIMCDENPRTGRKSVELMLLLNKDLLAHPVVL